MPSVANREFSDEEIRTRTQEVFGIRPCNFQIRLCRAQLAKKNIVSIAPTGSGKTLSYLMPLALSEDSIIVIVTALVVLGDQFVSQASKAGIPAISVSAENSNKDTFQDIGNRKYRMVVLSPEQLQRRDGYCDRFLWENSQFVSRLQNIIFDEGHCIIQWAKFRIEYGKADELFWHPGLRKVPVYISSATIPPDMLKAIDKLFRFTNENRLLFRRSNDRTNISFTVRRMKHHQQSFEDLAFLIPKDWREGDPPPPKFMIFFDDKKEAEGAAKYLQSRVSQELREKVPWFHAVMTPFFRAEEIENLKTGQTWGLAATDSGGMGLDVRDVIITVQWRVPENMNVMMQRFGRAVRDLALEGVAILIAEPHWFYNDRLAAQIRKGKRKRKKKGHGAQSDTPAKRSRSDGVENIPAATPTNPPTTPTRLHPNQTPDPRSPLGPLPSVENQVPTETVNEENEAESGVDDEPSARNVAGESSSEEDTSDNELEDARSVVVSEDTDARRDGAQATRETEGAGGGRTGEDREAKLIELFELDKPIVNADPTLSKRRGRSSRSTIDRTLCFFVNADILEGEKRCRRFHPNKFYANDTIRPDDPICCARCAPKTPRVCCDLCHPATVSSMIPERNDDPTPSRRRAPKRIKVPPAELSPSEAALKHELHEWRTKKARRIYPRQSRQYGPDLFLHFSLVDRIVDLARIHKLSNIKQLYEQTSWCHAERYGGEILAIVQKHCPKPLPVPDSPFTTTPLSRRNQTNHSPTPGATDSPSAGQVRRPRGPDRCGACKELGHRRTSRMCKLHPDNLSNNESQFENSAT